jgi:phospholipid/cholesterol/gamma-HCH transport system substrate-binding protein
LNDMANSTLRNVRLGVFVIAGTILFIAALYLIGNNRNLFGSTFRLSAQFHNVNGLMAGNNVRFAGIDVGTVESVQIVNDSLVNVVMIVEKDVQKFIRKNSMAAIGTDGLMGNKLVNISPAGIVSDMVHEGDTLPSLRPLDTDEMFRTLNMTNENVRQITEDLKRITQRLNSSQSLWNLLMDSSIAENVKATLINIRSASSNTAVITGDIDGLVKQVKDGKGILGAILTDTSLGTDLRQSVVEIRKVSSRMAVVSGDLSVISQKIRNGEGAVGALIMDTTFVPALNRSMDNIDKGTKDFSEIMDTLKIMWPFRKYFEK